MDEAFVPLKNKKAAELLAYLLLLQKPARKTKIAELLWPCTDLEKAMDSLYKVCRHLKAFCNGVLPLEITRDNIYFNAANIYCDIYMFEEYYRDFNNAVSWAKALELYNAPLLFDDFFEWTARNEAYYDMRAIEMAEYLHDFYEKKGNLKAAEYYLNFFENM